MSDRQGKEFVLCRDSDGWYKVYPKGSIVKNVGEETTVIWDPSSEPGVGPMLLNPKDGDFFGLEPGEGPVKAFITLEG